MVFKKRMDNDNGNVVDNKREGDNRDFFPIDPTLCNIKPPSKMVRASGTVDVSWSEIRIVLGFNRLAGKQHLFPGGVSSTAVLDNNHRLSYFICRAGFSTPKRDSRKGEKGDTLTNLAMFPVSGNPSTMPDLCFRTHLRYLQSYLAINYHIWLLPIRIAV
jgi:hypothetical protein